MFIACNFLTFIYLAIGSFLFTASLVSPSSCQAFFPHIKNKQQQKNKQKNPVDLCSNVQLITKLNLVSVKEARVSHENYS